MRGSQCGEESCAWTFPTLGTFVVLAHEFGHILQYKERITDSWEMEPHADFMAGWALTQALRRGINLASKDPLDDVERAAHAMFSFGDTAFNDPDHHGEPHYRAVMVRAGYESGNLGVKEAFEKGITWAGLKRKPA